MPWPILASMDGSGRLGSAVAPPGYHGGCHQPAEQQDPRERDERIDLRSRQPRIGGIFAESERCHRVHDQAEHDASAGAGGQRGRGHPRPPRGHPTDGDHVEGRQEQQWDLARPGRAAGRCARQVGAGVSGSIKDTQVNTPLRHGKRERRHDGQGRQQRKDRRIPAGAKEPGGPAVADRSEEPAGEQRQPGQQQHGGDHPELAGGGVTGRRVRPGGPGRGPRGPANSTARPGLYTISASLAISHIPPARQASRSHPCGTSCASAQTASVQSRRPPAASRAAARPAATNVRLSLPMTSPRHHAAPSPERHQSPSLYLGRVMTSTLCGPFSAGSARCARAAAAT